MNMLTNPSAPAKTHQSIFIQASPAQVWDVLTRIDNWPAWQPEIGRAHLNGALQPGTSFDWKFGAMPITSTLHTVVAARELGWSGPAFGILGIHNWTLAATPEGTQVTVDETMQGLLASVFRIFLNPGLDKGTRQWLERLKAEAEK